MFLIFFFVLSSFDDYLYELNLHWKKKLHLKEIRSHIGFNDLSEKYLQLFVRQNVKTMFVHRNFRKTKTKEDVCSDFGCVDIFIESNGK